MKRKLIFFSGDEIIFAKNLIYIDNVSSAPFQLLNDAKPSWKDYKQNDNVLLEYSSVFKQFLYPKGLNQAFNPRLNKIFLARKDSFRNYNQDKILNIAKKYGFKELYLEKLSLKEQITLFGNAEFVIGPSGAAWAGMVFAKENKLKCLTWMPDHLNEACTFSNLASLLGHELNYILFKNKSTKKSFNFHYDPYKLDANLFEDKLKDLISH